MLIKTFDSDIEFRNVWFRYGEAWVLRDINLTIKKGQTVALVGHSGSGKSTFVDLIPRFYDVTKGDILIDGKNIKTLNVFDLRSLMGNVNQEAILFNDTFENNITFGVENATREQITPGKGWPLRLLTCPRNTAASMGRITPLATPC